MNWKLKALALQFLSRAPASLTLHRWLQRKITGRYLDTLSGDFLAAYKYHVDNFLTLDSPQQSRAMEFGAGRNLLTPLLLSAAGAKEVFACDIARLATVEHINHVIRQLRALAIPSPGQVWQEIEDIDLDLKRYYRITYLAPADARHMLLPDGSIDFVCSTSTLEHISDTDIELILTECHRICSPSAFMSFIIDYHDHYSTFDRAITRFNFYRYSDTAWRWFNPSNHFQNRLRHSDYESIFDSCGLAAVEKRAVTPFYDPKDLKSVRLAKEFLRYSVADLAALNGFFLLKNSRG